MFLFTLLLSNVLIAGYIAAPIPLPHPLHTETIRDSKGTLLTTQTYYVDDTGRKVLHGVKTEYYDNGKPRQVVSYSNGLMSGTLTEYSLFSGEKEREETYAWGFRNGPSITWMFYPTQKSSECIYVNDRIVGDQLFWDMKGKLEAKATYAADGTLAEYTAWYPKGQKKRHGKFKGAFPDVWGGPYLAGKRDGTWTYWDKTGHITAQGEWREGHPWSGVCIVPTSSGSLWVGAKGTYKEGKLISKPQQVIDF